MTVHLATANSTYEIDEANKRIRRVSGVNPPTERFKEDGLWHDYVSISDLLTNEPIVISWPDGQPDLRDYTILSIVTFIITVDE